MRMFMLCLVLLPIVYCVTDLYMLGLFPMEGTWPGGLASKVAADIALEHINSMDNILVGYRLNMIWNNTKCQAGTGIDSMYRNLYNPPKKIILYGASCSFVSEATAQASHFWNLVQISYASSSPALSDKSKFPRFFRAIAPEVDINPARIKLLQKFGWSRISTIHESYELHSAPTEDLLHRMRLENMTVIRSEMVTKDPVRQMRNLKQSDARIVVGSFYEGIGRKAYCQAYKDKFYGPKIIYIINGWYEPYFWRTPDPNIDCTPDQLEEVMEGAFFVSRVLINPKDQVAISGIKPQEFLKMYHTRVNNKSLFGDKFVTLSYDTVWSIALALNASQAELQSAGNNITLDDFSYTDDTVGSVIFNNMKKVNFIGTAGQLELDEKGDPIGLYTINRVQNGVETVVGQYNPKLHPGSQIEWIPDAIVWENGKIPRDSTLKIVEEQSISLSLYTCICSIAGLGAILSVCFLVFNIYFRKVREVKMSSPRLNNVTLIGCVLLHMTPFLENTNAMANPSFCTMDITKDLHRKVKSTNNSHPEDPRSRTQLHHANVTLPFAMAIVKGFLLVLGFSLSFGALFVKTWRVHIVFTNSTTKKKIVKDTQLLGMVGGLVAVNMVVLLTWAIVDPITVISYNLTPEVNDQEDKITQGVVRMCESPKQIYFMATLFALQGILMLFGAFLAWETRKVKVDGLNDSKMIGMCVYNVLVLSLLGVTVSMALKFQVNLNYALTSLVIILATTVTQCLIFVPKVITVKTGGNQVDEVAENMTTAGRLAMPTTVASSAVTAQRLIAVERTLREKNNEIDMLKKRLEESNK